jgi:hypothetical protein
MRQYQNRKTKIVHTSTFILPREEGWIPLAEAGEKVVALETDSHMENGKSYTVLALRFINGVALYDFSHGWNRYAYRFTLEIPAEVSCL